MSLRRSKPFHLFRLALTSWVFAQAMSAPAFAEECRIKLSGEKAVKNEVLTRETCQAQALALVEKQVLDNPDRTFTISIQFGAEEKRTMDSSVFAQAEVQRYLRENPVEMKGRAYAGKSCEVAAYRNHAVATVGRFLRADCAPEVLYTWGSLEKIERIGKSLSAQTRDTDADYSVHPLFAARTPISSFGYGNTLMRIKLKPGTRIQFMTKGTGDTTNGELCANSSVKALYYERGDDRGLSMVDYVLCGTDSIESISYGFPELAREAVNELQWIRSKSYVEYDLWMKYHWVDKFLIEVPLDSESFTESVFYPRIFRLVTMAKAGRTFLFERKGEARGSEEHFKVERPTYFNELQKTSDNSMGSRVSGAR